MKSKNILNFCCFFLLIAGFIFRENELKRLKNSYRETSVQSELENRMHSLTQSLLSKQNNLENITQERNALKLQLEKLTVN